MSECESAGSALCEVIGADDGGLSMDFRTAADEARADLDAIILKADRGTLESMEYLKFFIDPF